MQSLIILGRQSDLGVAELDSLYGESKINKVSSNAVVVDIDPCVFNFERLGGSTKFCKLLTSLDTTKYEEVEKFLVSVSPEQTKLMPEGKMTLGLSLYGFNLDYKQILSSAIKLKKSIQATGRSVRIVPNKTNELSAAQIIHNKLTSNRAWELVIVKSSNKVYIAQTIKVQDIEAYSKRDQARPYRDTQVGMLPPKLAQIIINLASKKLEEQKLLSICDDEQLTQPDVKINNELKLLDPFCGTGVVLQEASLMGYKVIGSDISDRMVEYTTNNLGWLKSKFKLPFQNDAEVLLGDATKYKWPKFDIIASETNLGKPLSSIPDSRELNDIITKANDIIEKFLINVAGQLRPGQRLCLAVPAWQYSPNKFKHLPVIDLIEKMGYNFVDFKNISQEQLIYYRPGQSVARELLVITRK